MLSCSDRRVGQSASCSRTHLSITTVQHWHPIFSRMTTPTWKQLCFFDLNTKKYRMTKTTLHAVSLIRDRTLLIPTACIFVSKWWYVYLQDTYAHTSWSTITFCGTRGCEDPPETPTSHWGLSAPQSHSNLYLLALSHVFGLSSNMTSSAASSSLTTQAILLVFLHLLFSITSLRFISFIS